MIKKNKDYNYIKKTINNLFKNCSTEDDFKQTNDYISMALDEILSSKNSELKKSKLTPLEKFIDNLSVKEIEIFSTFLDECESENY